jgi:hypothetical protein
MGLPPEKKNAGAPALAELLYAWLSEEAAASSEVIGTFLGCLETFRGTKACTPPAAAGKEAPAGMPYTAEVFYGIKGKQAGVIRFLTAVAAREKPGTLLLYSDESIEWMADRSFLPYFVPLLTGVIARGNRIKIVHVLSRDLAEMLAAIDFWLPFYMTGAIEPYYCPRYREHFFRRTMFITPGVAALTAMTLAGQEHNAANIFSTDPDTVASLAREFNEFLSICRPLMSIFTGDNPSGLAELVTEFVEQPGDCICRSNTLSAVTMPEELLDRLLSRAGAASETKEKMLSAQRARAKAFAANLKHHKHTEIVSLPPPDEIAAGRVPAALPDFLGSAPLYYTPAEYKSHLANILHLLRSCPNFNFFTAHRGGPQNIRLAAKDEVGVIVAKADPPLAVFAINQPDMTNAFYCYLEEVISRLPQSERDRQQVTENLLELSGRLGNFGDTILNY